MFWRKVTGELPCKVLVGCKSPQAHIEVYEPGCCSPSRVGRQVREPPESCTGTMEGGWGW